MYGCNGVTVQTNDLKKSKFKWRCVADSFAAEPSSFRFHGKFYRLGVVLHEKSKKSRFWF